MPSLSMNVLGLIARCLLLAALASASVACSVHWYATPYPKPEGLATMGWLLQWMAFLCIWFGFRTLNPLAWMLGGLALFPLAQATVHWMAGEMGLSRDFAGWGGFQAMFWLHAIISCWLCMAAYGVYFILRRVQGLSANVIDG